MAQCDRILARKQLMANKEICICGKKMKLQKFKGKNRKWFCPYCKKDPYRLLRALMAREENSSEVVDNPEVNED